jgi:hypothetical protein
MLEKDQNLSQNQQITMNIINTERPVQGQARFPKAAPANNTPLTMERNSNRNTSFEPPPDSGSYANDDVLQAIRAIGRKKMKAEKNKKTKATRKKPASTVESETEEEEEEKESDTTTNEDSIEEKSDEEMKKHKKKTKKQPTSNSSTSDMIDAGQFKSLTIQELLDRYRTCTDQRIRNFIVHEMMQRSHGKSIGPVRSPENVVELTASTQKYGTLGANALKQEYKRLKSQITAITEPDILKIDQVPSALLFEIGAVHLLLQRALPDDELSRYNFSRNSQPFHPTSYDLNDHNRFANHSQNDQFDASLSSQPKSTFPPKSHQPPYSTTSPKWSQQHPYNFIQGQHPPTYPNEPPPYDNRNSYSHHVPYEQQQQQSAQFVHNLGTDPSSSSSPNLQRRFHDMHILSDHCENIGNDDSNEEIRKMNNSQLLAAYNDAYLKRNHAKSHILFNELNRRCYGDHPLLMHEKKILFDQLCKTYQGRSLNELKQSQVNIHQKIRGYLTNDDATHINNIPTEFMVEAGVLIHLIAAANSHP